MSDATSSSETQASGGVLSDQAIREAVDAGKLIVGSFEPASLHAASYDVTIARDGLILPNGERIPPGRAQTLRARGRPVVLESGDTAMFSTSELLCMPGDIAGNLSIKNRLAAEGLTLLSGLLVDPGYGVDETADDEGGCRLFLHVANAGSAPILLKPGEDAIARIQFLPVIGGKWEQRKLARASRWSEQQQASLGFLTEMKELKERVETTSARSEQIVLFGVVVLAVALIGASFSAILSIVTNSALSERLHDAWPASSRDGIVWALILLATTTGALAIVLGSGRIGSFVAARRRRTRRRRAL
jgi:deoxycytidine triphosphate deaminase